MLEERVAAVGFVGCLKLGTEALYVIRPDAEVTGNSPQRLLSCFQIDASYGCIKEAREGDEL